MTPQILIDIVEILTAEKIKIAEKVEGEGRVASLNDEGTSFVFYRRIQFLENTFLLEKPGRWVIYLLQIIMK